MADRPTESPAEAADQPGVNPVAIALRRWPLLVVGVAVGAALGVVIQFATAPTYQSSAQVLVIKNRTDVIGAGDVRVGVVEDYVATQVTLIKSQVIRLGAVKNLRSEPMNYPLPADDYAAAEALAGGLSVIRDKDAGSGSLGSSVLILTFRGPDPADTRRVLDAVIKTYQAELGARYDQATQDRLKNLLNAIQSSEANKRKASDQKLQGLTELRGITTEDVSSLRSRVTSLTNQEFALRTDKIDLDEQLGLIRGAGKDRRNRLAVLTQLTAQSKPSLAEAAGPETQLRGLEAQKKRLSQELGRDHPRMKELDAQIGYFQDEIRRQNPENPAGDLDELAAVGARLAQRLKTVERQLKDVQGQLLLSEKKLLHAGPLQDRVDSLTAEIAQNNLELNRLELERGTVAATQSGGGYSAKPITPPAAGGRIGPIFTRSLMMGIAIGLLIGGLAVAAAELTDKSFRSPDEIRRRLGLPIMGFLPIIRVDKNTDPAAALSPSLATAVRPKSGEAEAFRGLRTQLYFSTQGRGHQVIQVTSPNPGDGKSTLTGNLAVSVAQSGKRVVLLDADFRKPRIHKLFGLDTGEAGLAGVVSGEVSLAEAVRPSGVPNLEILPCGPRPGNPAELLTSARFQEVLAELKAAYDVVLVDTPPMLAVSDPAAVAPRVDGVLLVFRMTNRARPAAERAREQLHALGANVLGVVVNGWAGDRRGKYGYGYGYGEGYRYVDYQYADDYEDASGFEDRDK